MDGSLWLWGNNCFGQLGNGSTEFCNIPTEVMSGVKQVSLGLWHSAALKTDGSLWLWGDNSAGQLGNGRSGHTVYESSVPVKITFPGSGVEKTNIAECKITLSKKRYKYTGKVIKPLPKIKYNGKILKNKTDYTLFYKNNKKRGTATIIVKRKGAYTGQSQIKFTIKK